MLTLNLPYLLQLYLLTRDCDPDKNEKKIFFKLVNIMHLGKEVSNRLIYHEKANLSAPYDWCIHHWQSLRHFLPPPFDLL